MQVKGARKRSSCSIITSRLLAGVALAAISAGAAFAQDQAADIEQIVVTGTHVVRDGYNAPTPVTVLSSDSLQAAATIAIADSVNRMPELSNSSTPQNTNNGLSAGSAGLNNLNLRGIGALRTLVLLDGERVVGAIASNGGSPDINNFPSGLVSRVDVVTGGASAAYGSDAVAGVVNFVLNRDFNGIKSVFEGGESSYGDNISYKAELTLGAPVLHGRGHIEVYGSISASGEVPGGSRPWSAPSYATVLTPGYTATNGLPQYSNVYQVANATTAPGGIIVGSGASAPLNLIAFGPGGTPYKVAGTVTGINLFGGNWQATESDQTESLLPAQNMGNVFGRFSYAINDHFEVYAQLQWAASRTYQSGGLPAWYAGNLTVASNNPFIPASIKTEMTALGLTSLTMGTFDGDLPKIQVDFNRTFQRGVVGADGGFNVFDTDWKWEAYIQQSTETVVNRLLDDPITANLKQAIASVQAPSGAIVCSNPANSCVPFNPFGTGVNTPEAIRFVDGTGFQVAKLIEDTAALNISGNPFSDWAGPVSLATGVEWRKESTAGTSSALDQAIAFDFGNFTSIHGEYNVIEGYVETVIPLAANVPWAEELDINAAARETGYSTSGNVTTWKVGLSYQPIDDLRLRATRSQDIRAPDLGELFTGSAFSQSTFVDDFQNYAPIVTQNVTKGNLNLVPETAETTSVGVILTPGFLPGFQASVDYYNISIGGAIATVAKQAVIDQCFLGNTALCSGITRNAAGNIILITSQPVNVSFEKTNGVDIDLSYNLSLSAINDDFIGDISSHFLATKTFEDNTLLFGVVTNNAGTENLPSLRYNWATSYNLDPVKVTATVRYVSTGKYANNYVACTSGCPASTVLNPTYSDNFVPSNLLIDLAFDYKFLKENNADLFLSIDNVANTDPPNIAGSLGGNYGLGMNNKNYDRVGRMVRAGLRFQM